MTKTEARTIAREARRYGHYTNGSQLSVNCPRCRCRVTTEQYYVHRLARKGEPGTTDPSVLGGRRARFERQSVTQALDAAMIEHLLDECSLHPDNIK